MRPRGDAHHGGRWNPSDSFIPGFSRFQTNLLGFAVGALLFIILVLFNWLLVIRDKRKKIKKYKKNDEIKERACDEVSHSMTHYHWI